MEDIVYILETSTPQRVREVAAPVAIVEEPIPVEPATEVASPIVVQDDTMVSNCDITSWVAGT